jgi:hypothetical protein
MDGVSYRWRDTVVIEPGLFIIHGFFKRYADMPGCGSYRLTLRLFWGFDGLYGISGFAFMRPFAFDLTKRMA